MTPRVCWAWIHHGSILAAPLSILLSPQCNSGIRFAVQSEGRMLGRAVGEWGGRLDGRLFCQTAGLFVCSLKSSSRLSSAVCNSANVCRLLESKTGGPCFRVVGDVSKVVRVSPTSKFVRVVRAWCGWGHVRVRGDVAGTWARGTWTWGSQGRTSSQKRANRSSL